MHQIYSKDRQTHFGFMNVGPLFKLHHRSTVWIIIYHIYLLCTSVHRTTLHTTMFHS